MSLLLFSVRSLTRAVVSRGAAAGCFTTPPAKALAWAAVSTVVMAFVLPLTGTALTPAQGAEGLTPAAPAAVSSFDRGNTGLLAQPDSAAILERLRERQAGFESFRESRIPPRTRTGAFRCDVRIGRICHWFGGADETDFPPEPVETGMARRELLGELSAGFSQLRHPWILGQLVQYLMEDGRPAAAVQVAEACGLEDPWWCHALRGYALHIQWDFSEAEAAFAQAMEGLPATEEDRWLTPRFILSPEARSTFQAASPQERRRLWDRLWRFSNPLFLVDGNDRLTEHYARLVLAMIREEAGHPFQLTWEEDLEESLIRYGREIGWSRTQRPTLSSGLGDPRTMVGHHHPGSRGYLFPEEFLVSPADVPPEAWITAPREARTWYAAPYAPDFRGLETQVARFRRGDSLLVVGAYRPDPSSAVVDVELVAEGSSDPFLRDDPFRRGGGDDPFRSGTTTGGTWDDEDLEEARWGDDAPVRAALFLIPEDGGDPLGRDDLHDRAYPESRGVPVDGRGILKVEGEGREGVFTLLAPAGRYVSSLELLDEGAAAAWRARQGVVQVELEPGEVAVSDVILLGRAAPFPDALEDAIPHLRPGIRVGRDERFLVAWEVYGMGVADEARVTLGFTRGRPGFLRRVGEFLGVVESDAPLEITFRDVAPDEVDTVFRALEISLPQLEPGAYTLHVEVSVPGREPALSSRPILVEEGSGES